MFLGVQCYIIWAAFCITFTTCLIDLLSRLTSTAQGPSSTMKIHKSSPQTSLSSSRFIHPHWDTRESLIMDFYSREKRGIRVQVKYLTGPPDREDVVVETKPLFQCSLKTKILKSFFPSSQQRNTCKLFAKYGLSVDHLYFKILNLSA